MTSPLILSAVQYTLIHTLLELAALPFHVVGFLIRRGRFKAAVLRALDETARRRRSSTPTPTPIRDGAA